MYLGKWDCHTHWDSLHSLHQTFASQNHSKMSKIEILAILVLKFTICSTYKIVKAVILNISIFGI